MASYKVAKYHASWDILTHAGTIAFWNSTGGYTGVNVKDKIEFKLLVDLLRNERPLKSIDSDCE